jgi:hypothetical protein
VEPLLRLTTEEIVELKKQKPCKAWRLEKPKYAEEGKNYTSAGEEYTVLAVDLLSDGDVLRRFGKSEYEKQREDHGPSWRALWLIVIVAGDRTDRINLLAPTGSPGDGHGYTSLLGRAMPEEPEAISRVEARKFALAVREAYALKREEKRRGNRKQRYENKVA